MKEFLLLFRQPDYDYSKATPEQMQALAKKWQAWPNCSTGKTCKQWPPPFYGREGT